MARQIQIRRGTAAENDAFTGAIGEVTMDTTNKTLRVHDGETVGGTILARGDDVMSMATIFKSMAPDYSAGVSKPTSGFTADADGWIRGVVGSSGGAASIKINGVSVLSGEVGITGAIVPILSGDVITKSGSVYSITFFPYRGAIN